MQLFGSPQVTFRLDKPPSTPKSIFGVNVCRLIITMTTLRGQLRALPSITGTPPTPLIDRRTNPQDLVVAWLQDAIAANLPEPHAITLSTVDEHSHPDGRVVIIKNIDNAGNIEVAS